MEKLLAEQMRQIEQNTKGSSTPTLTTPSVLLGGDGMPRQTQSTTVSVTVLLAEKMPSDAFALKV
jgi:hypothetical protein